MSARTTKGAVGRAGRSGPADRRPPRRDALAVSWLLLAAIFFSAPLRAAEPLTVRSRSGQFLVRGTPMGRSPARQLSSNAVSYVRLDPSVLAVSCERIKDAVLGELGLNDAWRGSISVAVHPVQEDNEPIVVTSIRFRDRWGYRLETPDQVGSARLIQAVVQVVLTEIANRRAGAKAPQLPPWLVEGFAAHLEATALAGFALEPGSGFSRKGRRTDPFAHAREVLRARPPLNLEQLSWPTDEPGQDAAEVYQCCAHLFVSELLRLKRGPQCLGEMLFRLPDHLNWQTAFFGAFQNHFDRQIDLDKWWSLNVVHFLGRDPFSVWPVAETWRQFDEALATPVQVRMNAKDLPLNTQVKLQSIVAEWDYARQAPVLAMKANLLAALRQRAAPELADLVEDYRAALASYLEKRSKGGALRIHTTPMAKAILHETLRRLDELDEQRARLRAPFEAVQTARREAEARERASALALPLTPP